MRSATWWLLPIICGAVSLPERIPQTAARARDPIALTGRVSSAEEGPMEGVLVSAKKTASTITITVVTDRDRDGMASLNRDWSRASTRSASARSATTSSVARSATVAAQKTTTADLKLRKTRDLAAQLTNAEWLASFPGHEAEKASIRGCAHCHTLERIVRTHYDADRMVDRHRAHVGVSAALVPVDDSEAAGAADRRRPGIARAAAGDLAAAGGVSDDAQPERGSAVELRAQDAAAAERAGDAGHLHRVRPARSARGSRTT